MPLNLPQPPPVNNLYRNVSGKGRRKTKRYMTWIRAAGWMIREQKPQPVEGWVIIDLTVNRPDKRKRDISNTIKAVEDLLVEHRLIEDDSMVYEVRARWGKCNGCEVRYWSAIDMPADCLNPGGAA